MSLKAKITLLSAAVTGTVIFALFLVQMNNAVESWLANTYDTAELTGNHVKQLLILRLQQRASREQSDDAGRSPDDLLRTDPQFTSLLESTMAQAHSVVEVSIAGQDRTIVASSSPLRAGGSVHSLPDLRELRAMPPLRRMLHVLNSRASYQVSIPLGLANRPMPVYTIHVVVSAVLVREALMPALRRVAQWGAAGLISSVFLAWASARLLTGNLSLISSAIDRIVRGEEPGRWNNHDQLTGEFVAIESKLNVLGHQFRGAAQLRSVVDKVLDGLREGILLFGEDGRITLAGGAVEDVLGVRAADLNGRLIEQVLSPETPSAARLVESYHSRQPVREQRLDYRGIDAVRHLIVNLDFASHGVDHEGKSALLRIRDAAGHRELESQVGMMARLDGMSRVTSSVAHEIKNPLNSIAVRLDNLQAWVTDEFPAAEEEIALIVREINRLDRVVRTFLDFTRPIEIRRDRISLTALLDEIVGIMKPGAIRRGVTVCCEHPAEPVWVRGDDDLLKEALLNLVTNALEAMPNGGTLQLVLEQNEDQAHILVADTGPGIPESQKERIFELYYTTKKDGSGLGLPMTFRTVQLHGGTIHVDSGPNQGSSFHLYLPSSNSKKDANTA